QRESELIADLHGSACVEREEADQRFVVEAVGGQARAERPRRDPLLNAQVATGHTEADPIAERVREGEPKIRQGALDPVRIELGPRAAKSPRKPARARVDDRSAKALSSRF